MLFSSAHGYIHSSGRPASNNDFFLRSMLKNSPRFSRPHLRLFWFKRNKSRANAHRVLAAHSQLRAVSAVACVIHESTERQRQFQRTYGFQDTRFNRTVAEKFSPVSGMPPAFQNSRKQLEDRFSPVFSHNIVIILAQPVPFLGKIRRSPRDPCVQLAR